MTTPSHTDPIRDIVRLEINLNVETADALKQLAVSQGVPLTEVVRRAISLYKFLEEERAQGRRIQTANPASGEVRELILS